MKQVLGLVAACLVALALLSGCQPEEPEEPFDEAALLAIYAYVEEISYAMKLPLVDLKGWVRELYVDDYPYSYDQERQEWLAEYLEPLRQAAQLRQASAIPEDDEIAEWEIVVVQGETEWLLEGDMVLNVLDQLDTTSGELIAMIEKISGGDGELTESESDQVNYLLEEVPQTVKQVRVMLYR